MMQQLNMIQLIMKMTWTAEDGQSEHEGSKEWG